MQPHAERIKNNAHGKELEIISRFEDQTLIRNIRDLLLVITPLANCVSIAERKDSSLGETVHAILEFAQTCFKNWRYTFIFEIIVSFLNYFNSSKLEEEYGLMLTAYALDKRWKMDYLTVKAKQLVFETMFKMAINMGLDAKNYAKILLREFMSFRNQNEEFGAKADRNLPVFVWWKNLARNGILKELGLRCANLKSSSANTERTFSMIKIIEQQHRTALTIDAVKQLLNIKLAKSNESYDNTVYKNFINEKDCNMRRDNPIVHIILNDAQQIEAEEIDLEISDLVEKLNDDKIRHYLEFKSFIDFAIINDEISYESEHVNRRRERDEELPEYVKRLASRIY